MKHYKILVIETEVEDYDDYADPEVEQKVNTFDNFKDFSDQYKNQLPEFTKGYTLVKTSDLAMFQTKPPLELESNFVYSTKTSYYSKQYKEFKQGLAGIQFTSYEEFQPETKFYIEVSLASLRKAFPQVDEKFKKIEAEEAKKEAEKTKRAEARKKKELERAKALLKEAGEL